MRDVLPLALLPSLEQGASVHAVSAHASSLEIPRALTPPLSIFYTIRREKARKMFLEKRAKGADSAATRSLQPAERRVPLVQPPADGYRAANPFSNPARSARCASANILASSVPLSCIPRFIHSMIHP